MREFELLIYSDVACPWCYIGWKRLERVLDSERMASYNFTLKPRFLPYLINETLDDRPVTKQELYEDKFLGGDGAASVQRRISAAGQTEGIAFDWSKGAKVRQTRPSHRVLEKAYEIGGFPLQAKLAGKLYSAFNEQAIDVGDPPELARIASSEPGFMDYDAALAFIQSDEGEYELDKALQKGRHWGIDQVPTYILDETDSYTEAIEPDRWFKAFDVLSRAYGLDK